MNPIIALTQKKERLAIGFMSGTSADGIDAVLVRISGHGTSTKVQQLAFCFVPFSSQVRKEILRLAGGASATAADFCQMNFLLGELYCQAGKQLCCEAGIAPGDIDFIGNHGQTVWHIPQPQAYLGHTLRSTLQIGEDAMLAEAFGCPVVGDFRVRDVAAGGLGAPLVPYTEFLLYHSDESCIALQNIGGIGNVTILPRGCKLHDVVAFDTGPGNMVMDALVSRQTNGALSFDEGGNMAARGHVHPTLLAWMMEDPYLRRRPPKTTGREYYGPAYVERLLQKAEQLQVSQTDVLSTATRFTAETIAYSIQHFSPEIPAMLVVGGGGSMNATLMRHLSDALPHCAVKTQEDLGFDSNAKEAVAFAILANETIFASSNNASSATGARHPVVMGKISL